MNYRTWINCSGSSFSPVLSLTVLVAVSIAVYFGQSCCSAEDFSSLSPVASFGSTANIKWVSGPKNVNFGEMIDIQLPKGFYLTDAEGARAYIRGMNNPVPKNIIGVLTTESGKWWAILEYTPKGYVKTEAGQKIDSDAVLKSIQAHQAASKDSDAQLSASLEWAHAPAFDTATHSLDWGIKFGSATSKVVNDTELVLGRQGVLEITAVQPYPAAADAPNLSDVAQNITFKAGETYADFKSGDKVAKAGLTDLMVDDESADDNQTMAGINRTGVIGMSSAVVLCAVFGGIILHKKNRGQRQSVRRPEHRNGSTNGHAAVATNGATNGTAIKLAASNGHRSAANGTRKRRREFSYNRFYNSVVMEMSSSARGGWTPPVYRKFAKTAKPALAATNGLATAPMDLLALQKSIIDEQKNIIQQQTTLIEQKRRLLEEQNAVLKKQFELIDEQYSMKFS